MYPGFIFFFVGKYTTEKALCQGFCDFFFEKAPPFRFTEKVCPKSPEREKRKRQA
jgi:hypothetical protein